MFSDLLNRSLFQIRNAIVSGAMLVLLLSVALLPACGSGGGKSDSHSLSECSDLIPEGWERAELRLMKKGASQKEYVMEFEFRLGSDGKSGEVTAARISWPDAFDNVIEEEGMTGRWRQEGELVFDFNIRGKEMSCENGRLGLKVLSGWEKEVREGVVDESVAPCIYVKDDRADHFASQPKILDLSGSSFLLKVYR